MPKDPLAIKYKRWRNRSFGYLVDVVDVKDYVGASFYRVVTVQRVRQVGPTRTWAAEVFLRTFEPVGRKLRKRTAWDLLQE